MRVKVTRTVDVGGHREWTLEIERGLSVHDELRYAAEGQHRLRMALEAIVHAPERAEEIAREAIE